MKLSPNCACLYNNQNGLTNRLRRGVNAAALIATLTAMGASSWNVIWVFTFIPNDAANGILLAR